MFIGLILEGNKKATLKVTEAFRISMAALELPVPDPEKMHSVFVEAYGQKHLLCTLSSGSGILQVPLALEFNSASEYGFFVSGGSKKSKVHLTGYVLDKPHDVTRPMLTSTPKEPSQKTQHSILVSEKKKTDGNKKKVSIQEEASDIFSTPNGNAFGGSKPKLNFVGDELYEDDSEEEEEEDENEKDEFELDDDDDEEEEEDEDEGDSDESDEESDMMDEEENPTSKPTKQLFKKSKLPQQGNEPKTPESKKSKPNDSSRTPESFKTPEQNSKIKTPSSVGNTPMKFVTKGGVMVQEIKVGNGLPAKSGKMVNVGYVGRLKQNNKQFDSGSIKFRIGKGEVIKGWDIGVEGMKIGGKRKLIIPPQLGYGKKGAAPDIPPNSTLVFDVELKGVS